MRRTPVIELVRRGLRFARVPALSEARAHAAHRLLQSGSSAFAHLLTRDVPEAGVVAASGGNHGAAVAFAARKLEKNRRKSSCRGFPSPAKVERIRREQAVLEIGGERYADALLWGPVASALPRPGCSRCTPMTRSRRSSARPRPWPRNSRSRSAALDTVLVAVGRWWAPRRRRFFLRRPIPQVVGVEPKAALLERGTRARSRAPGRRRGRPASPPIRSARGASARTCFP